MGFTISSSYPTPITATGAPDVIRMATLDTILQRDRFVFAFRRRMLCSLSPFSTTSAIYVESARLFVHNSKITSNSVQVVCYGANANIRTKIDGVTTIMALGAAPSAFSITVAPGWVDDSWIEVSVEVQATAGTGGYSGLYMFESALNTLP
jgi:hypothetical protein